MFRTDKCELSGTVRVGRHGHKTALRLNSLRQNVSRSRVDMSYGSRSSNQRHRISTYIQWEFYYPQCMHTTPKEVIPLVDKRRRFKRKFQEQRYIPHYPEGWGSLPLSRRSALTRDHGQKHLQKQFRELENAPPLPHAGQWLCPIIRNKNLVVFNGLIRSFKRSPQKQPDYFEFMSKVLLRRYAEVVPADDLS